VSSDISFIALVVLEDYTFVFVHAVDFLPVKCDACQKIYWLVIHFNVLLNDLICILSVFITVQLSAVCTTAHCST